MKEKKISDDKLIIKNSSDLLGFVDLIGTDVNITVPPRCKVTIYGIVIRKNENNDIGIRFQVYHPSSGHIELDPKLCSDYSLFKK